jgi:hypothetical protein
LPASLIGNPRLTLGIEAIMQQKLHIFLKVFGLLAFLQLGAFSVPVWADDDCTDPVAQWQSRQVLKNRLEQQGWRVRSIRIDDGCYEVEAFDDKGRRVKAKFTPASFTLIELKVSHEKPAYQR